MISSCFPCENSSGASSLKPNELSYIPPLRVCLSHNLPYVCFVTQCANPENELFLEQKLQVNMFIKKHRREFSL